MIWLPFCTSRDAGRQGFAFLEDFLLRTRSEDLGELKTLETPRSERRELEKTGQNFDQCSLRGVAFDRPGIN